MRSTHASDDNDLPRISKQIHVHVRIDRTVAPRTSWRTVELQVNPYEKLYIYCAQRVAHGFGLLSLIRNIFFQNFKTKNSWENLWLIRNSIRIKNRHFYKPHHFTLQGWWESSIADLQRRVKEWHIKQKSLRNFKHWNFYSIIFFN